MWRAGIEQRTPAARVGTAQETAAVIAFLLSSDAGYMTGQNVVLDGGSMLTSSQMDPVLGPLLGRLEHVPVLRYAGSMTDPEQIDIPKIISVDDHVIEPPDVWQDRLPERFKEAGPRSVRQKGTMNFVGGVFSFEPDDDGMVGDWWEFEGQQFPLTRLEAAVGFERDEVQVIPITYDEMRQGCWDRDARLVDMDANWTEASMAFPSSFVRFCGQRFYEADDKELADACVKAYNDWQVEEWCAGHRRPTHPPDHRPAVGPGPRRRGGAPKRASGAYTR